VYPDGKPRKLDKTIFATTHRFGFSKKLSVPEIDWFLSVPRDKITPSIQPSLRTKIGSIPGNQLQTQIDLQEPTPDLAGRRARFDAPYRVHLDKDHPQEQALEVAMCCLHSRV
jgi:hypothetical protein